MATNTIPSHAKREHPELGHGVTDQFGYTGNLHLHIVKRTANFPLGRQRLQNAEFVDKPRSNACWRFLFWRFLVSGLRCVHRGNGMVSSRQDVLMVLWLLTPSLVSDCCVVPFRRSRVPAWKSGGALRGGAPGLLVFLGGGFRKLKEVIKAATKRRRWFCSKPDPRRLI